MSPMGGPPFLSTAKQPDALALAQCLTPHRAVVQAPAAAAHRLCMPVYARNQPKQVVQQLGTQTRVLLHAEAASPAM
jgi:hypothetical protein